MPTHPAPSPRFGPEALDQWFPPEEQRSYINLWIGRVGLTRRRAECFVRLWGYLLLKQILGQNPRLKPPLGELTPVEQWVSCSHREAASLFYSDQEQGSERAAGLMLDKLVHLGLLQKFFDGNVTCFQIIPQVELARGPLLPPPAMGCDGFDPRCDAIPVAQMLARNYNWMNRDNAAAAPRIARLLRSWAAQYGPGMRVLRREDNQQAVGFYLLYPTAPESESCFFTSPSKSLHLSSGTETDPIQMAAPGCPDCHGVFVRSWVIDSPYLEAGRVLFLEDLQQVLRLMQVDYPNLCDLHTMIIHPAYEKLARVLGFQRTGTGTANALHWMYLPLDRYLTLDLQAIFSHPQ